MTTTHTPAPADHQVYGFASGKITQLQNRLLSGGDSGATRAAAQLRRSIGRPAGSDPELWDITMSNMPSGLVGRGDDPSPAESAVHLALCLYATAQQSSSEPAHLAKRNLGEAISRLVYALGEEDDGPVRRRFAALVTSASPEELARHLRSIVPRLRGAGIAMDYAGLAADLYRFSDPTTRDAVRLRWGRSAVGRRGLPVDKGTD